MVSGTDLSMHEWKATIDANVVEIFSIGNPFFQFSVLLKSKYGHHEGNGAWRSGINGNLSVTRIVSNLKYCSIEATQLLLFYVQILNDAHLLPVLLLRREDRGL